ncbi:hypothetical protein FACS1894147_00560 [Spirochaetia bacterium]|nr:hypothetical protein FACS1894147_00560 [Spirochaetia bacterium]
MAELTEKDYDALDEDFTNNPPMIDPNRRGTGYFTQRKSLLDLRSTHTITIDTFSADYLTTKAIATHKTPSQIVGEMVRERIGTQQELLS